jgi:hypothetical protein
MSLPFESLLTLQAYADGELEGTEQAAAEKLLEESEEARAFVESLGVLGIASRAAYALEAEAAPEIDVVSAVMARIEADTAPVVSDGARVTSLAAERSKRARTSQAVVIIGALALAAAGILYVRGHHEAERQAERQAEGQAERQAEGPKPELAQTTPAADKAAEKGVEVHDIDSNGQSQVSVFYLPASGGNTASSVVVWIDDKGAP